MLSATSSSDSNPAITFENVRIGFDEGDILRGVSFQVRERETLVLLGETGTGKTLSLKLAAGLLRPSEGTIRVLGKELSGMPERDLLEFRRHIGFVFQEGALFDSMTVGDNVAYRLQPVGHVVSDGHRIEKRALLKNKTDVAAKFQQVPLRHAGKFLTQHADSTLRRPQQSRGEFKR